MHFCYTEMVVLFAVIILVLLFMTQQYGTGKVWFFFSPIVLIWLLLIGGIGIFNILKYDRSILKAFSPVYVYRYFKRRGRLGWESLGGIMLSINGITSPTLLLHPFSLLLVYSKYASKLIDEFSLLILIQFVNHYRNRNTFC